MVSEALLQNSKAGSEKKYAGKLSIVRFSVSSDLTFQAISCFQPSIPNQHSWNTPTQTFQTLVNYHGNKPSKIWLSGELQPNPQPFKCDPSFKTHELLPVIYQGLDSRSTHTFCYLRISSPTLPQLLLLFYQPSFCLALFLSYTQSGTIHSHGSAPSPSP